VPGHAFAAASLRASGLLLSAGAPWAPDHALAAASLRATRRCP